MNLFRCLVLISVGQAILAVVTIATMAGGRFALLASAALVISWVAIVIYGVAKFNSRARWFLLGAPLIGIWCVLFRVAAVCVQNVKACP